MEDNERYLVDLHKHLDNPIERLRPYAIEHAVPIVDRLTLDLINS
ncbi:hypothetical protein SEVCU139_0254 [Staphylococcus lugdunensis VCU139]|nr:hypothetical protein SEVCU139_0254 [Staphylococcus lugdunensis VCU139]